MAGCGSSRWLGLVLSILVTCSSFPFGTCLADHVGLYMPGWYQTSDPNGDNYFNYNGIDLTGVSVVYYSFAWIRGNAPYELYDAFDNLG